MVVLISASIPFFCCEIMSNETSNYYFLHIGKCIFFLHLMTSIESAVGLEV